MTSPADIRKSILIFALSGLGKTSLCRRFPRVTYDTDLAFDASLAAAFPKLAPDDRYTAWRTLARSERIGTPNRIGPQAAQPQNGQNPENRDAGPSGEPRSRGFCRHFSRVKREFAPCGQTDP
ncbi:MAG: hypothetical protein EXR77_16560 [Myxococcales bacterium]|nr:hypothetical protein [Myxococcales bacterium]